jgi:hypothetical protein
MAENEIAKHTKAAYNAITNHNRGWKHKVKDVLLEVCIIVFAVTVSIWFHNWSDEVHDRKEAREYLAGLKKDIEGDMENMQNSQLFYENELNGLNYYLQVGRGTPLDKDSLDKYSGIFLSSTELRPHVSRYEALKGSGKFRIIENKALMNAIIHLHEETILHIINLNTIFDNFNVNKIIPYLGQHLQLDTSGSIANAADILRAAEMRFFISFDRSLISTNIIRAYSEGIRECTSIIKQIDDEVK